MKMHLRAIAFAIAAFGLANAIPAAALADTSQEHYTVECTASYNACEEVVNAYAGSNYVYRVYVWDPNSDTTPHTYRLLFNQVPRYSWYGDGGTVFYLNYYVDPGKCIQGGVEGVPDGRTPCWFAP
jgi:ABC-type glycerol-3-phosphate transport system substrate-binding protein